MARICKSIVQTRLSLHIPTCFGLAVTLYLNILDPQLLGIVENIL